VSETKKRKGVTRIEFRVTNQAERVVVEALRIVRIANPLSGYEWEQVKKILAVVLP